MKLGPTPFVACPDHYGVILGDVSVINKRGPTDLPRRERSFQTGTSPFSGSEDRLGHPSPGIHPIGLDTGNYDHILVITAIQSRLPHRFPVRYSE